MLPPQLRQSAAARRLTTATSSYAALKATTACSFVARPVAARTTQHRTFWLRRPNDYTSPTDPAYHRFHRIRTLKTRAKLLENIRRRGKFEWDVQQRPFFTPKQIRWASHWNDGPLGGGGGAGRRRRRQWWLNDTPEGNQYVERPAFKDEAHAEVEAEAREGEEGRDFELARREKLWHLKREQLRKRIEADPYEAVFGKRFEPFWGSLVPSWMREEMGLQERLSNEKAKPIVKPAQMEPKPTTTGAKESSSGDKDATTQPQKEGVPSVEAALKQTSYAKPYTYSSSTSWDSWSNKATKTEWDSVSNETKQYEYDPITNRMVQIASSPADIEAKKIEVSSDAAPAAGNASTTKPSKSSSDSSAETRKAIPIPPMSSQPSLSQAKDFISSTSLNPARSTAISSSQTQPSALAKMPKNDIDLLTANDVRASMGKTKPSSDDVQSSTPLEKAKMERDFDRKSEDYDAELNAIMKQRNMIKDELLKRLADPTSDGNPGETHRLNARMGGFDARLARMKRVISELKESWSPDQPSKTTSTEQVSEPVRTKPLQSSVDRLQSKDLPKTTIDPDDSAAHESTEPTSTVSIPKEWSKQSDLLQADRVKRTADSNQPRAAIVFPPRRWIDDMEARKAKYEAEKAQNELIAERANAAVKAKVEKANHVLEREVSEQKLRMHLHETRNVHKQSSHHSTSHPKLVEQPAKTRQIADESGAATAMEKLRKSYKEKIASLRGELETAYKQSTVHSEQHLDRIRALEQDLAKAQAIASEGAAERQAAVEKCSAAYKTKVVALREELEIAYKQSTVHAEEHLDRIRWLERELGKARISSSAPYVSSSSRKADSPKTSELLDEAALGEMQAEGDFCPNIIKFVDNEKWYKQPAKGVPQPSKAEVEQAELKLKDQQLVREVREIYEKRYGLIDTIHRQVPEVDSASAASRPAARILSMSNLKKMKLQQKQPKQPRQVVEVESDVDLGEELAKFEKEQQPYRFQPDGLEKEISGDKKQQQRDELQLSPEKSSQAVSRNSRRRWEEVSKILDDAQSSSDPDVYRRAIRGVFRDMIRGYGRGVRDIDLDESDPDRFLEEVQARVAATSSARHGLHDHGLFSAAKSSKASSSKTKNHQAALRERSANNIKKSTSPSINPVDGTRASTSPSASSSSSSTPATGNFASPTGFVNHDPVFPAAAATEGKQQKARSDSSAVASPSTTIPHPPTPSSPPPPSNRRVRRQEPHFTGTTTARQPPPRSPAAESHHQRDQPPPWLHPPRETSQPSLPAELRELESELKDDDDHELRLLRRELRRVGRKQQRQSRAHWRRKRDMVFPWVARAAWAAVAAACAVYLVGAVAEKGRERERERGE